MKKGIMLLEVIIAISLMAILVAVAVPNFRARFPEQITNKFFSNLNVLSSVAWQSSITTGRLHRVIFDFTSKKISIEQEKKDVTGKGLDAEEAFESVPSAYMDHIYYPKHLEVKNFYVAGKDELMENAKQSWFFITPLGITQEVVINLEDNSNPNIDEPDAFGLVLNPFSAQFKKYETAQNPS